MNNNGTMTSALASDIPQPLTSTMFMSPDVAEKAATSLPTMFVLSPDEDVMVMRVPVPAMLELVRFRAHRVR